MIAKRALILLLAAFIIDAANTSSDSSAYSKTNIYLADTSFDYQLNIHFEGGESNSKSITKIEMKSNNVKCYWRSNRHAITDTLLVEKLRKIIYEIENYKKEYRHGDVPNDATILDGYFCSIDLIDNSIKGRIRIEGEDPDVFYANLSHILDSIADVVCTVIDTKCKELKLKFEKKKVPLSILLQ